MPHITDAGAQYCDVVTSQLSLDFPEQRHMASGLGKPRGRDKVMEGPGRPPNATPFLRQRAAVPHISVQRRTEYPRRRIDRVESPGNGESFASGHFQCLRHLSVAVIAHHDQGDLRKGSSGLTAPEGLESIMVGKHEFMAAGNRKLGAHIFGHKHEAKRAN